VLREKDGGDHLDRLRENEVLHRVKEERNILHTIKRRTKNWIGHDFRKNCNLKHVIERKMGGTERRGRTRKQLFNYLMKREKFWKLQEETPDIPPWTDLFGRVYKLVVRQTTKQMALQSLYSFFRECEWDRKKPNFNFYFIFTSFKVQEHF
jgi:hypothetical protein